jgi:hypothetical protein
VGTLSVDPADLEGCIDALHALAGADDDEQLTSLGLAKRLLGPSSVLRVPNLQVQGCISTVDHHTVIIVRKGLDRAREQHVIGHELGHWILRREGVTVDDEDALESACDYVGAGIVIRRRPFARVLRGGYTLPELAAHYRTSETLVALRQAEVTGQPRAVVAPHAVRVRGQLEFVWPEERTLRRWATGRAAPGVVKVRLKDDPRRVVLDPQETG